MKKKSGDSSFTAKDIAFREWAKKLQNDRRYFCLSLDPDHLELFRHLVQLQLPLPTPLHPRAVPKGQPHHVPLRPDTARRQAPRWLRFVDPAAELQALLSPNSHRQSPKQNEQYPKKQNVLARSWRQKTDGFCISQLVTSAQCQADYQLVATTVLYNTHHLVFSVDNSDTPPFQLLHVASRGSFGSSSSWFDPYERWFPLSMYIAHIWQVHLQHLFDHALVPSPPLPLQQQPTRELWTRATVQALRRVLAVHTTRRQQVNTPLRESLLFHLLSRPTTATMNHLSSLLYMGTPQEEWRTLVYEEWHILWTEQTFFVPSPRKQKKKRRRRRRKKGLGTVKENEKEQSGDEDTIEEDEDPESEEEEKIAPLENPTIVPSEGDGVVPLPCTNEDEENHLEDDGSFQKVERNKKRATPKPPPAVLTFRKPQRRKKQAEATASTSPPPPQMQSPPPEYVVPPPQQTQQETMPADYGMAYASTSAFGTNHIYSLQSLPPIHDPSATIRTSNAVMNYGQFGLLPEQQQQQFYTPWEVPGVTSSLRSFPGALQQEPLSHRNESILSELFDSQRRNERDHSIMSTAASMASSSSDKISDDAMEELLLTNAEEEPLAKVEISCLPEATSSSCTSVQQQESPPVQHDTAESEQEEEEDAAVSIDSPSPPATPSPTLSPIFVSLSEISTMKESLDRLSLPKGSISSEKAGGHVNYSTRLTPVSRDHSCSSETGVAVPRRQFASAKGRPLQTRDDQEIKLKLSTRKSAWSSYRNPQGARDDHDIKLRTKETPPQLTSCRSSVGRSPPKHDSVPKRSPRQFCLDSSSFVNRKNYGLSTSRSETALEGDDYQNWQDTATSKGEDGDITVHTEGSPQRFEVTAPLENEAVASLREERNMYQDMCLTLGAEVAKLRTMLAAQKAVSAPEPSAVGLRGHNHLHPYYGGTQMGTTQLFPTFPFAPRAKTLAAMSDTGYRGGEHESLASEDEMASRSKLASQKNGQLSSAVTLAESDASLDQSSTHNIAHQALGGGLTTKDFVDEFSAPHQPVRSRLGQDIYQLMEIVESQLHRMAPKRRSAVERMTRLVETMWPRAQVNIYGSHATGLCVPSSDVDFVISLPAVHKKAVAVAPGALEGRNAINETSQKQLARHLKSESWIDPRSMKLIDRTFVPVIKVATKDTRAKTLHLDISFEAPGHHGLEATRMITLVLDEFPVVRLLVIVLKLLLIDRSLLESYSGGLSSYCLFLMVTRYVQEQDGGLDVGALLMGFLDFHGNHFDPRATGISVRHRQYFARLNFVTRHDGASNAPWRSPNVNASTGAHHRRNSATSSDRPKLQAGIHTQSYHTMAPIFSPPPPDQSSFDSGMPYTFDPLFVEDPLSDGNNVGRNAFRIFQVQRAFSDAHRALVAALEWEREEELLPEAGLAPLLKCLFQNDGAVFDLQV